MRKPRDFDADLKALEARANQLKTRKQQQLGELVIATGADALPIEELAEPCLPPLLPVRPAQPPTIARHGRAGARRARPSFSAGRRPQHLALIAVAAAHRRSRQAVNRLWAQAARHDTREWQVKRRERTRYLIELGGLIIKAGLVELADDDRAVLLGVMLEAAARLRGEDREQALTLWRRRGQRAFAADRNE
jgi:hypothetical protein